MVHRLAQRTCLAICSIGAAALLAAGCGGSGEDDPGGDDGAPTPKRVATPLEPAAFTTTANLKLVGENPISTALQPMTGDAWLLNAGVQTSTGGIATTLFRSTDDAASFEPIDTGRLMNGRGVNAVNAIATIGTTWIVAGTHAKDTPADDAYLPAVWTSIDEGDTWKRIMLPPLPRHHGIVNDMIEWQGAVYAIGQVEPIGVRKPRVGMIWRSEDGVSWKRVGPPGGFPALGGREVFLQAVDAAGDDGLVVVGSASTDTQEGFADLRSTPIVLTSRDGSTWKQYDLERPSARAQVVAIGGNDGRTLVIGGSAGTKGGGGPWFEVARLEPKDDVLELVEDIDQVRRVVDPARAGHGVTGLGLVQSVAWDGTRFVAGVLRGRENAQSLTFWRAENPDVFVGLGTDGAQPKLPTGRIDTLGDMEVTGDRIIATGRVAATQRIAVVTASRDGD